MMHFEQRLEHAERWQLAPGSIRQTLAGAVYIFDSIYPKSDAYYARMVLQELFLNAVYSVKRQEQRAGDEYKGKVNIRIGVTDGMLHVAVEDNGTGVNNPAKLFRNGILEREPEYTGGACGTFLSRKLVEEELGGHISYEHIRPNGARFFYEVPINYK